MLGWLGKRFAYLQAVYEVGAVVLIMIALAAFQGLLVVGLPLYLLGEVFGWGPGVVQDWFLLSAIVWLPITVGVTSRYIGGLPHPTPPDPRGFWHLSR